MANGNPWFSSVEQTLPEYVPIPLQQIAQAGQAVQGRYDTAMSSIDQTSTGLGSMEALAPAHREYRDQLVGNYREEVSNVLDRYDNNASDPQFLREINRINTRYASDPNISTIRMGNESIKAKQKAIQDIYSKGGRYIDTNPRFSGVDESGRLSYDAGQVRSTNFAEQLDDMYANAAKSVIDDGNISTNRQALEQVRNSLIQGVGTNPVTRDALQYYAQQGYSQEEALAQLENDLDRSFNTYLTAEKVDTNDRLAISRQNASINAGRLALAQQKFGLDLQKYKDELAQTAIANSLLEQVSPIEAKNNNAGLISQVNQVLNRYDDSGNIKTGKYQIANTPENKERYPDARTVSASAGVGGRGQTFLEIDNADVSDQNREFIQAAKEIVDPNNELTDKQALDSYKLYLEQDNNAPTFWNTPIKENRDNIVRNYIGSNGENLGNAIYIDRKGRSKRVADGDVDLTEFKSFDFGGITSSPINMSGGTIEGGAIKVTAVNEDGEAVMFMQPLDPALQTLTELSNLVSKATVAPLTNRQLLEDPNFIRQTDDNVFVVPQKNQTGGIDFYQVIEGRTVGQPIDPTPYIKEENQKVGEFFGVFRNKP